MADLNSVSGVSEVSSKGQFGPDFQPTVFSKDAWLDNQLAANGDCIWGKGTYHSAGAAGFSA